MRSLGRMLAETYTLWMRSVTQCCGGDEKPRQITEKPEFVFEEPALVPPPSTEPWPSERVYGWEVPERSPSRKRSTSRGGFSVRRRWLSNASSRRPQISAPSNFRHLNAEPFSQDYEYEQYSQVDQSGQPDQSHGSQRRQRPRSFRPLELSIYMPENNLSPLLPHFDSDEGQITPPPPAHTHSTAWDDSSITLTHERSYSSTSFHLPRRHVRETSSFSITPDVTPPRIPPRSRARAYTSPSIERMVERIASAMIEKERLEAEIESVIERQSIYLDSRPSTAYGLQDLEPMPSIPALPANAPSFAERLSTDGRPHTAPSKPLTTPKREAFVTESPRAINAPSTPQTSYSRVRTESPAHFRDDYLDRPLAPPLPLVLRPPLRKKKSFSRVSNWLFPGAEHQREMSMDSVTNLPKPVTDRDGYYQCVAPPADITRTSVDTVSSTSSWETEEEGQTVPTTTWSPGSSPAMNTDTPKQTPTIERMPTFGRGKNNAHRPQSVGVAF